MAHGTIATAVTLAVTPPLAIGAAVLKLPLIACAVDSARVVRRERVVFREPPAAG